MLAVRSPSPQPEPLLSSGALLASLVACSLWTMVPILDAFSSPVAVNVLGEI